MASRKEEIVTATLELLARVPVERVTTRAVADRVGVSQPALFRHFASREEMLRAVVHDVTGRLREELHALLVRGPELPGTARDLAEALLRLAGRHPGIPALFLHDTVEGPGSAVRVAVQHLVAVPTAFVAELVRGAERRGRLPRTVDADAAASMFVALLQGTLVQARREGRAPDPAAAERLAAFWWAALEAGEPGRTAGSRAEPVARRGIARLDVRPIIAGGEDPLATVLETVGTLREDGALMIVAPFRPTPLEALLAARGWRATSHPADEGHWCVEVLGPACPGVEDLTDLEAPLPLERVLLRASALTPGEAALFRVPRHPAPLLARLAERALESGTATAPDGVTLVWIRRPSSAEEARA